MKIVVQGLWHLGTVTAAALASVGHDVVGLDFDHDVVAALKAGKPPVFEPGLAELVHAGLTSGRLSFTDRVDELPVDAELHWVAYDTPVNEDDVADVNWVREQVMRALPHVPATATVLVSSQLPVGSTLHLATECSAQRPDASITFAASPENLRLGKSLDVFLNPDRVIVGVDDAGARARIAGAFAPITDRIEWMSVSSAEMTKHAINAFLATSVVFANEIATLCEAVGADAKEVERGLKTESRIGPKAYVSPGGAFAGGTLARDVEFLRAIGEEHRVVVPLLGAVKVSNDHHKAWVRRRLSSLFPKLDGVVVVVWGLTYKPDTDTLRRSLAVELCDWLLTQGAVVRVHDYRVPALPLEWTGRVTRFAEPLLSLAGADVLLIGSESPDYRAIGAAAIASAAPQLVVLDANGFLGALRKEPSVRYLAVGTPSA